MEEKTDVVVKSYSMYIEKPEQLGILRELNTRIIELFRIFSQEFYNMREFDSGYHECFALMKGRQRTTAEIQRRVEARERFKELMVSHRISKDDCHDFYRANLTKEEYFTAIAQINAMYSLFEKSVRNDKGLGYFHETIDNNVKFDIWLANDLYHETPILNLPARKVNLDLCGESIAFPVYIVDGREIDDCINHAYVMKARMYWYEKLELKIVMEKSYVKNYSANHSQPKQMDLSGFKHMIKEY